MYYGGEPTGYWTLVDGRAQFLQDLERAVLAEEWGDEDTMDQRLGERLQKIRKEIDRFRSADAFQKANRFARGQAKGNLVEILKYLASE
jgi:hypothetical protein